MIVAIYKLSVNCYVVYPETHKCVFFETKTKGSFLDHIDLGHD